MLLPGENESLGAFHYKDFIRIAVRWVGIGWGVEGRVKICSLFFPTLKMKADLALLSYSCSNVLFTDTFQQICLKKGGFCNLCDSFLSAVSFENWRYWVCTILWPEFMFKDAVSFLCPGGSVPRHTAWDSSRLPCGVGKGLSLSQLVSVCLLCSRQTSVRWLTLMKASAVRAVNCTPQPCFDLHNLSGAPWVTSLDVGLPLTDTNPAPSELSRRVSYWLSLLAVVTQRQMPGAVEAALVVVPRRKGRAGSAVPQRDPWSGTSFALKQTEPVTLT